MCQHILIITKGIFRVAKKCDGISLTKVLLYLGFLSFDDQCSFGESASESVVLRSEKALPQLTAERVKNVAIIKRGVMAIVKMGQNHPDHYPSLSPNNIYITYGKGADRPIKEMKLKRVKRVVLVDIGVSNISLKK